MQMHQPNHMVALKNGALHQMTVNLHLQEDTMKPPLLLGLPTWMFSLFKFKILTTPSLFPLLFPSPLLILPLILNLPILLMVITSLIWLNLFLVMNLIVILSW